LGTISLDFFKHGVVSYGGALINLFAVVELCLAGGFAINQSASAGWDVNRAVASGMGIGFSATGGFKIGIAVDGSVPEC
jgi:hypothetical protein